MQQQQRRKYSKNRVNVLVSKRASRRLMRLRIFLRLARLTSQLKSRPNRYKMTKHNLKQAIKIK